MGLYFCDGWNELRRAIEYGTRPFGQFSMRLPIVISKCVFWRFELLLAWRTAFQQMVCSVVNILSSFGSVES